MSLQPAMSIIDSLGGAAELSKGLGISYCQVRKWTWSKQRGGTGGLIPQRHHLAVLNIARQKCVPLTAADFLPVVSEAAA